MLCLDFEGNSHNIFCFCVVLREDKVTDILGLLMDKNNNQNFSKPASGFKDTMLEIESKTQKIVTALYLVSDLIEEQDPLRKDIRNISVSLSSLVSSMAIESPSQAKKTITEAQNHIDRILNILKVCVSVGFVSDMNFKVISEYLVFVRDDLNQKYGLINSQSLVASSFHNKAIHEFVLPDFITKEKFSVPNSVHQNVPKETKKESVKDIQTKTETQNTQIIKDTNQGQESNNQRLDKIITIVQSKGEVSVGDVSSEFPEISEKTIQRMLIKLVETGQLTKTGEKRWSRYSLTI